MDSYLGRVIKADIVEAVSEAVSEDAARRIADMKKPDMAQTAEQLLAGTVEQPSEAEASDTEAKDGEASYAVAAELRCWAGRGHCYVDNSRN